MEGDTIAKEQITSREQQRQASFDLQIARKAVQSLPILAACSHSLHFGSVRTHKLSKSYKNTMALKEVSLTMERNEGLLFCSVIRHFSLFFAQFSCCWVTMVRFLVSLLRFHLSPLLKSCRSRQIDADFRAHWSRVADVWRSVRARSLCSHRNLANPGLKFHSIADSKLKLLVCCLLRA